MTRPLKFDLMLGSRPVRDVMELAGPIGDAGFSGAVVTETGRTAYLAATALALHGDLDVLTGIAVAFPRSPMVTAQVAWELAEASGGRFRLGLGTQVRAHIERRYSTPFDPPGPRMREYLGALRAIFAAFGGGERLDFSGDYYQFSLLPDMWSPGEIGVPNPPVDIAAVNPWMLRLAGEAADGVHVHPLNNPTYLRETVLPALAAGAAKAGRDPAGLEVIAPAFLVVGDSDEEQHRWREMARTQVAFYGSTPNYAFIFDQLGHEGTTARIREQQKKGDVAGMAAVVSDDLLEHFTTTATWSGMAAAIRDRYAGLATRVVSYFSAVSLDDGPDALARWREVADGVTAPLP